MPQQILDTIIVYFSENLEENLEKIISGYGMDNIRVYNASSYIVFPIGDESIQVRNVNVTTETTTGANSLVSVSFENLLKEELSDVRFVISGDVNDGQIIYRIGNVAALATKYAEHYLSFSSAGQKNVKLELIYVTEKGEEKTKEIGEYIIDVKDGTSQIGANISLTEEEVQNQIGRSMNLSIIFLALGGVVLLVAVSVLIYTRIKKKNE